jgi:hypothetical protein
MRSLNFESVTSSCYFGVYVAIRWSIFCCACCGVVSGFVKLTYVQCFNPDKDHCSLGGANDIEFALPVVFIASGLFPFFGAPVRSLLTAAVNETPQLSRFEGTMQVLLSMAASVGGFTAPSFLTHFCLRKPEEVSLSNDGKECMSTALLSPLLSLAVLASTNMADEPQRQARHDKETADEKTALVREGSPKRTDGDLHKCSLREEARSASC